MAPEQLQDFAGWPAEGVVFPVGDVKLRVLSGEHPVQRDHSAQIAANWQGEVSRNPALFDGRLIFHSRVDVSGGGIRGEGHVTPFSAFMWWRRQALRPPGIHVFAYPAIETSDGALVAIRMGAHTANPGQVYFAAGSLEPEDVVDGFCDIDLNMRREVMEETGLDLSSARVASSYHASHMRSVVTIFRLFRFAMTAGEMIAGIEAHMRVAEDKEIAGAVAIRSPDPDAHPYNVAMLPILDWYFGREHQPGLR